MSECWSLPRGCGGCSGAEVMVTVMVAVVKTKLPMNLWCDVCLCNIVSHAPILSIVLITAFQHSPLISSGVKENVNGINVK